MGLEAPVELYLHCIPKIFGTMLRWRTWRHAWHFGLSYRGPSRARIQIGVSTCGQTQTEVCNGSSFHPIPPIQNATTPVRSPNVHEQPWIANHDALASLRRTSKPSDGVFDFCEELVKFTLLTRDASAYLTDRYGEWDGGCRHVGTACSVEVDMDPSTMGNAVKSHLTPYRSNQTVVPA
jgi:hypothetical protein